MAEKANGSPFGMAVCEMLGVDPNLVECLTITVQAHDFIRVQVDMIPSFKQKPEIERAIQLLREADKEITASQNPAILDITSLADKHKSQEFVG